MRYEPPLVRCKWCEREIPGTDANTARYPHSMECANCWEFRTRVSSVPKELLRLAYVRYLRLVAPVATGPDESEIPETV